MTAQDRSIEDMQSDFNRLRDDVDRLADLDKEDAGEATADILRRLIDMLETVTLQQVAGYQESAKAFQAIGDALRGIMRVVGPGGQDGHG